MLVIENVTFCYPETRITTNFSVKCSSTVGLMGPSGSGKTTILNLIAGFLSPDSGRILFNHQDIGTLQPAHRPLSYLFQNNNLFPHLTVWQNIAIGIKPTLKLTEQERSQISSVLHRVSLDGFEQRRPTALSGGQQQRVGLARCLLRNRPILLLDEPFSALDKPLRADMTGLIAELQRELGLALVISTHQEDDVLALNGNIVELAAH